LFLGNLLEIQTKRYPEDPPPPYLIEQVCDEVAHRVLLKVDHPLYAVGANIALYLVFFFDMRFETDPYSSHPSPFWRLIHFYKNYDDLCFGRQMTGKVLLEIPHRWLEEENYMKRTQVLIRERVDLFMKNQDLVALKAEAADLADLCAAMSERGFSFPDFTEDRLTTFISDGEDSRQAVRVNVHALLAILLGAFANLGWATNPVQFGALLLSLVFVISDGVVKKLSNDAAIVLGMISTMEFEASVDTDELRAMVVAHGNAFQTTNFDSGVDELLALGILGKTNNKLRVKEFIISVNIDKTV
jgi:hypothetical protein